MNMLDLLCVAPICDFGAGAWQPKGIVDNRLFVNFQASFSPRPTKVSLLGDKLAGLKAAIVWVGNSVSEAFASSAESKGMYWRLQKRICLSNAKLAGSSPARFAMQSNMFSTTHVFVQ